MNRLILKYELDLDFVLIAITTPLRDYMLCHKVNKQLNIDLFRIDELELSLKNESFSFFSRYLYQVPDSETEYYLITNKGSAGYLIPEMNKVDYFFLIRNFIDKEDLNAIIEGINKLSEVAVAVEVNPEKLKSKENLIF